MSLIDTLRAFAITVRNEKKKEANSAVRIGDLFLAIIDFIKGIQSGEIRQDGVDTYNDTSDGKTSLLNKYSRPELNWTALVRNDETNEGKASLYKWNGSKWINLETAVYIDDVAISGGSDKTLKEVDQEVQHRVPMVDGHVSDSNLNFYYTDLYPFCLIDKNGYVGQAFDENGDLLINGSSEGGIIPINNPNTVIGLIFYGQSNSTQGGSSPYITENPVFRGLTFQQGTNLAAFEDLDNGYAPLRGLKEGIKSDGESPCSAAIMMCMQQLVKSNNNLSNLEVLSFSGGQGGTTIDNLSKGTSYYNRLITAIQKANDLLVADSKTFKVGAIGWDHGEADKNTDKSVYKAAVLQLKVDLNTDIKAITGQTEDIPFIFSQTEFPETALPNPTIAQMEMNVEEPDMFLSFPNYIHTYKADNIHFPAYEGLLRGARYGLVFTKVLFEGKAHKGIYVNNVQVTGREILLTFKLPDDKYNLVADTENVVDPGYYGFRLTENNSNRNLVSAEIVSRNQIKIVSVVDLVSGMQLRYALRPVTSGSKRGRVEGARGCIRDNQGDNVKFEHPSLVTPVRIDNWMPSFYVTI